MRAVIRLLTIALIPMAMWAIFSGSPQIIGALMAQRDPVQVSLGYAERLFEGVLSFESVLSSRYMDKEPDGVCEHVFVRLAASPPSRPPASAMRHDRDFRFGGVWRPTPVAFADTPALKPVETCVSYVGRSLAAEVLRVLRQPGAFYYRDLTDGTLHLYAPRARMAGRVRIAPEGRR